MHSGPRPRCSAPGEPVHAPAGGFRARAVTPDDVHTDLRPSSAASAGTAGGRPARTGRDSANKSLSGRTQKPWSRPPSDLPHFPATPLQRLPPPPSSAHLLPCRARCHSPWSPLQSVTFLATRALQVNQPKEVDDPALGRLSLRKRQNPSFVPAEARGARCRETRSTRRLLRPPGRADGCLLRSGRGEIAFLHPLRAAEGAEVEFISPSRKPRKAGISAFAKTQNFQTHI